MNGAEFTEDMESSTSYSANISPVPDSKMLISTDQELDAAMGNCGLVSYSSSNMISKLVVTFTISARSFESGIAVRRWLSLLATTLSIRTNLVEGLCSALRLKSNESSLT